MSLEETESMVALVAVALWEHHQEIPHLAEPQLKEILVALLVMEVTVAEDYEADHFLAVEVVAEPVELEVLRLVLLQEMVALV